MLEKLNKSMKNLNGHIYLIKGSLINYNMKFNTKEIQIRLI